MFLLYMYVLLHMNEYSALQETHDKLTKSIGLNIFYSTWWQK